MREHYQTWTIWKFPRNVKNRFVGAAKASGMTVACLLEYLIQKHLREKTLKGDLDDVDFD